MTWDERVKAIADHGFTERQAGFLVTVMLHSGVCLGRQLLRLREDRARWHEGAGLLSKGRGARVRDGASLRAQHGPAVTTSITSRCTRRLAKPDNRHRRPLPFSRAVERLMVLDAVLAAARSSVARD